jgi:hypothetical protein
VAGYQGMRAWLSTMHEKLDLIAPAMMEHAGLAVLEIEVDTDQLGTFSGETPRTKSPLETAIAKAKLGLVEAGGELGLASEGSIGPDSQNPFLVSDIETVVFVDLENELVIHESHRSFEIVAAQMLVSAGSDLDAFLSSIDFPNQRLIARVLEKQELEIFKGIQTKRELQSVIEKLQELSGGNQVLLETDFRAHQSPSRRKNISVAAQKLAKRISKLCPGCNTPGFGLVRYQTGLHCESCSVLSESAVAKEILCCVKCEYSEAGKVISTSLSPEHCDWCNP